MVTIRDVMGFDNLPDLKKPRDIVNYMIALQTKTYGQAVDLPYVATLRNMKLLIKKHGSQEVVRGIFTAVHISEYPYSTAFVEEMILQRRKDKNSSFLMGHTDSLE